MEALEAHVLPSSRLANEAAGTTIRFIQARAHYTLRSMPRSQSSQATALKLESAREVTHAPRRQRRDTKRLSKRVVQKADGRYLIYYEKA